MFNKISLRKAEILGLMIKLKAGAKWKISGGFRYLIVVATISMILIFVGVVLALIKFRAKEKTRRQTAALEFLAAIPFQLFLCPH